MVLEGAAARIGTRPSFLARCRENKARSIEANMFTNLIPDIQPGTPTEFTPEAPCGEFIHEGLTWKDERKLFSPLEGGANKWRLQIGSYVFPGTILENDSRLLFSQPLLILTASNHFTRLFPVVVDNMCSVCGRLSQKMTSPGRIFQEQQQSCCCPPGPPGTSVSFSVFMSDSESSWHREHIPSLMFVSCDHRELGVT